MTEIEEFKARLRREAQVAPGPEIQDRRASVTLRFGCIIAIRPSKSTCEACRIASPR